MFAFITFSRWKMGAHANLEIRMARFLGWIVRFLLAPLYGCVMLITALSFVLTVLYCELFQYELKSTKLDMLMSTRGLLALTCWASVPLALAGAIVRNIYLAYAAPINTALQENNLSNMCFYAGMALVWWIVCFTVGKMAEYGCNELRLALTLEEKAMEKYKRLENEEAHQ